MLNLIAGCSVADNGQCAVIEDEPLMIDLDCHDSTIFVWQTVPQYDDLHCILWESCC
jgi:hypothetical protein